MPKISALPVLTAAAADDELPVNDASATTTKRMSLTILKEWLQTLAAWITPAMWTNPYKFRARQTSTQNLTAGAWTKAQIGTEDFDTNGNFDTGTYRWTCPETGYYSVQFQAWIASAGISSGYGEGALYKNGSALIYGQRTVGSGSSSTLPRPGSATTLYLVAGDYLELYGLCSESSRQIVSGDSTFLSAFMVSKT